MKKIVSVLLLFLVCFAFAACSGQGTEPPTSDGNEYLNSAPILGVEIKNEEEASFYALTKNGSYTWTVTDENGEETVTIYDGLFCLDFTENLCTFTREKAGGSINLKFTGSVLSYEIYCAEKSEVEKDKTEILNENYRLENNQGKITFPESGEYYYVVNVKYAQGEVPYGFLLAE